MSSSIRRSLIVLAALGQIYCGGSPTTPTPTPPVIVVPTPVPVLAIAVSACPASVSGVDLGFYQQIACNTFEGPQQPARRWTVAPKVYIRTVDEAGTAIDGLTLDIVSQAMQTIAPQLTAGKFGISIERGPETRRGASGYITVTWGLATDRCGFSDVAVDGGVIQFNPQRSTCACNGSKIYPRAAAHELGHALGYWHTDNQADLMFPGTATNCEPSLSARELQAVAYHYR